MMIVTWLKQTPLWLLIPSMFLSAGIATAVLHHEPLVFDPALYAVPSADAAELDTIDAKAIEAANAANAADAQPADVPRDAPAVGTSSAYADGSWTGYAACGKNNPDHWKPYYVGVVVEVSGGEPHGIKRVFGSSTGNSGSAALRWDADENQKYLDWADSGRNGKTGVRAQLAGAAVASDIDTVSGATYSSVAIFNAYLDALGKAAKAAGNEGGVSAKPKAASSSGSGKSGKSKKVKAKVPVGKLEDGTFTAYAQCGPDPDDDWKPYYVGVTLTVKDGAVASIDDIFGSSSGEAGDEGLVYDAKENQQYLEAASYGVGEQLKAAAAHGKVLGSIDTVSGATFSSKSIYAAYYGALQKSAEAAGSSVEVSEDDPEDAAGSSAGAGADAGAGAGAGAGSGSGTGSGTGSGASSAAGDSSAAASGDAGDGSSAAGDTPVPATSYYGYAYCSSSSSDSWSPYYVFVQVSGADGKVTGIAQAYGDADGVVDPDVTYSASENALYLNWAIDGKFGGQGYRMKSVVVQIQEKIVAGAQVSGISTVSGATRSSRAIVEAYEMAERHAAADVGRTPEEAVQFETSQSSSDGLSDNPLVPGTPDFS